MKRWPEIDALRGLMLVLMTLTHLPTRFSGPLGQPFGFVSAAEGFVFLSAFMAGYIFTRRAMKDGLRAMRHAFLRRALKLYAYHVAMLVFLFTVIAAIGISTERQTIKNLVSFYLQEPLTAFSSSLLLIYNPPLLDILPMYVAFMVLSPWILSMGLRLGWLPVVLASAVIWLCAQFGLEKEIYQAISSAAGLKVPYHQTGAFDILAWQFIWMLGLCMGAKVAGSSCAFRSIPAGVVAVALAVSLAGLLGRHLLGPAPFGSDTMLAAFISKWHLGLLRVINFLALLVLTVHFGQLLENSHPMAFSGDAGSLLPARVLCAPGCCFIGARRVRRQARLDVVGTRSRVDRGDVCNDVCDSLDVPSDAVGQERCQSRRSTRRQRKCGAMTACQSL